MKEQILASSDEIIIRDLYPLLVSNKRLYIVGGGNKKFKSVKNQKIIQLDKISAVRYQMGKSNGLRNAGILLLILAFLFGGSLGIIYYFQNEVFDSVFLPLLIVASSLIVASMILFIIFACKTSLILYIEYPTNLNNKPIRIVFNSVKMKDFQAFISALFQAIDSQGSPKTIPSPNQPTIIL